MHYSAQTNTIMHTGDWSNQGEGLIVQNQEAMKPDNYTEVETLVVVTKEETPYVMKKRGRKGNAAYDGFAIDLLKVLYRPYGGASKLIPSSSSITYTLNLQNLYQILASRCITYTIFEISTSASTTYTMK